ncbi:hypothetical protein EV426DRAFT_577662 [Tirmania nivea]|nr:hypothetical protein EV426DRAFT_577662 [Tirmania nivea]
MDVVFMAEPLVHAGRDDSGHDGETLHKDSGPSEERAERDKGESEGRWEGSRDLGPGDTPLRPLPSGKQHSGGDRRDLGMGGKTDEGAQGMLHNGGHERGIGECEEEKDPGMGGHARPNRRSRQRPHNVVQEAHGRERRGHSERVQPRPRISPRWRGLQSRGAEDEEAGQEKEEGDVGQVPGRTRRQAPMGGGEDRQKPVRGAGVMGDLKDADGNTLVTQKEKCRGFQEALLVGDPDTPPHKEDVKLYSYVDDVNPVVVTHGLTGGEHDQLTWQVDGILEEEARKEGLTWDKQKESRVDFGNGRRNRRGGQNWTKTLGVRIDGDLSFKRHIAEKAAKASAVTATLARLTNSNGEISAKAARSFYTGCIRPMMAYGAELWVEVLKITVYPKCASPLYPLHLYFAPILAHHFVTYESGITTSQDAHVFYMLLSIDSIRLSTLDRTSKPHVLTFSRSHVHTFTLLYCTTVHRCSLYLSHHDTLAHITFQYEEGREAEAEPMVRVEREALRKVIGAYKGSNAQKGGPSTGCGTSSRRISRGGTLDNRKGQIRDLSILDPDNPDSKLAETWAPGLQSLLDKGWRVAYTDGSKLGEAGTSAVFYTEGPSGTRESRGGAFLGPWSTVADAERLGMALALEANKGKGMVAIASDSLAAISTMHRLAEGGPPRSGIESRLKEAITDPDREISLLRSHIGIPGNEAADQVAKMYGTWGGDDETPGIATQEGVRQGSREWRKIESRAPGYGTRRTEWDQHALSAYSWLRLGKAQERAHLLGGRTTWQELDEQLWVEDQHGGPEPGGEMEEGTEAFFRHAYWRMRGGRGQGEEGRR